MDISGKIFQLLERTPLILNKLREFLNLGHESWESSLMKMALFECLYRFTFDNKGLEWVLNIENLKEILLVGFSDDSFQVVSWTCKVISQLLKSTLGIEIIKDSPLLYIVQECLESVENSDQTLINDQSASLELIWHLIDEENSGLLEFCIDNGMIEQVFKLIHDQNLIIRNKAIETFVRIFSWNDDFDSEIVLDGLIMNCHDDPKSFVESLIIFKPLFHRKKLSVEFQESLLLFLLSCILDNTAIMKSLQLQIDHELRMTTFETLTSIYQVYFPNNITEREYELFNASIYLIAIKNPLFQPCINLLSSLTPYHINLIEPELLEKIFRATLDVLDSFELTRNQITLMKKTLQKFMKIKIESNLIVILIEKSMNLLMSMNWETRDDGLDLLDAVLESEQNVFIDSDMLVLKANDSEPFIRAHSLRTLSIIVSKHGISSQAVIIKNLKEEWLKDTESIVRREALVLANAVYNSELINELDHLRNDVDEMVREEYLLFLENHFIIKGSYEEALRSASKDESRIVRKTCLEIIKRNSLNVLNEQELKHLKESVEPENHYSDAIELDDSFFGENFDSHHSHDHCLQCYDC